MESVGWRSTVPSMPTTRRPTRMRSVNPLPSDVTFCDIWCEGEDDPDPCFQKCLSDHAKTVKRMAATGLAPAAATPHQSFTTNMRRANPWGAKRW